MHPKKAEPRPQLVINNNQINAPQPPPSVGVPALDPCRQTPAHPFGTRWSTGLCGCCEDPGNCFCTCICPCITFGQVVNILSKGKSSQKCCCCCYASMMLVVCTACLLSWCYRREMRKQYMLRESDCPDCLMHCCCEPCALCQMYRQLHAYNFDLQLGYKRSMEMKAPPVQLPMAR